MAGRYFYTLLVVLALSSFVKPEPQENATDVDLTTMTLSSENEIYESSSIKSISENTKDAFSESRTTTENSLRKETSVMSTENEIKAIKNEKEASSSTSENPIEKTSEMSPIMVDTTPYSVESYVSTFATKEYSTKFEESTSVNIETTIQEDNRSSLVLKNENIVSTSEVLPSQVATAVPSMKVPSTSMIKIVTKDSSTILSMKDSSTASIKDDSITLLMKDSTTASSMDSTIAGEIGSTIVENTSTSTPKQTYQEAEKEITEYINSLLRSLLPQIIGGSGDAQLSKKCTAAMMKVFSYIRRMKGWTVKMLDSMGKPSSGILHGTSYSMGDYDQCLDLSITNKGAEATDPKDAMFRGQYCRVKITLPEAIIDQARSFQKGLINATDLGKLKDIIQVIPYIPVKSNYMTHFIGLCFPSTCTSEDLEQLVQLIPFPGDATVDRCEMKMESKVDFTQLIVICIFLVLCILVVASTFFDCLRRPKKEEKSEDGRHDKKCVSVTVSFSLCNNTRRLMKHLEDEGADESSLAGQSVRGIFVVAVAWMVLGHTYLFPYEGYYFHMSSLANLRDYWDAGYFSIIMTFPLAIDALLVCFGFLLTYILWHVAIRPEEITVNVIKLIVKNYLRLCIPLLLCFGIIFVLPLTGSGPFWGDLMERNIDRCRQNYLAYFGMYSNFLEWEEQCFPHLWFVSCCAQLTLVGIFLCWILSRNVKVGIWITLSMIIACNAGVAVISYWNNFPPSYLAYFTDESSSYFWQINMAFPLSHFGSYAVGMLSGIFIARRGTRRNRGCLGIIGWIACIGLLYAIFLVLYNSRDGMENALFKAVLAGVHRTAFALCISWIMVACSYGLGGFVNAFLSWRVFDPLFRLSYYAYIFHFIIISYIVSISKVHFSFTHIELVLRAFSYLGVTYFLSYILYLLLEMPLISLKEAFCPKRAFRIEVTPLQTYTSHKGDFISKNTIEGSVKLWSITESTNGIP